MKLAFREHGHGQPLIILHGLFGQSDNWNTIAKQLGEKGFRVFTVDQRNHGLSPHSTQWTYESMAADLQEFVMEHDLKKPVLLGHSMGAKTVLFFEFLHPGISDKLILADMSARQYPDHHTIVLKALNAVDFSQVKNRKEAEAILSQYLQDFGTKQFLLKNIYYKNAESGTMDWRFNLEVITRNYDNVRQAVPFYKSNTSALVIRGNKSDYVQAEDIEDYRQRFSNLKLETLEGAGHWVHAEKPKEFLEAVLQFIRS